MRESPYISPLHLRQGKFLKIPFIQEIKCKRNTTNKVYVLKNKHLYKTDG